VLFEYVVEVDGGRLLDTRWDIYIQNLRNFIYLYCSAESDNFEKNLRPVYERFMQSTDITFAGD